MIAMALQLPFISYYKGKTLCQNNFRKTIFLAVFWAFFTFSGFSIFGVCHSSFLVLFAIANAFPKQFSVVISREKFAMKHE